MAKQKITLEIEANALEALTIQSCLEKIGTICDSKTLTILAQKCEKDKEKINNKIQKRKTAFMLL